MQWKANYGYHFQTRILKEENDKDEIYDAIKKWKKEKEESETG